MWDGDSDINFTEDSTLLGCDAVSLSSYFPTFRKIIVFPAMKAQISFETAGNTLPSIQDHVPEDLNRILDTGMPIDASLDFTTSLHAATMT